MSKRPRAELYHVGLLLADRLTDRELDARAEAYLERGTRLGVPTRPDLGDDSPRGRGEGCLVQRRAWPGVYEYWFVPRGASGLERSGP